MKVFFFNEISCLKMDYVEIKLIEILSYPKKKLEKLTC